MLSPRWRKIVRDLWSNKTRTALVVASIAVGIFAVGVVQQLRTVILGEMQRVYVASNAAHATLFTDGIDHTMIESIRRMPEVADAAGRSTLGVKVQVAPGEWQNFTVTAIDDFQDIRIDLLQPVYAAPRHPDVGAERTAWPIKNELILELGSLDAAEALPAGLAVGDVLTLETPAGRQREMMLAGLTYDANAAPATFTGTGSGFVTYETFERLGGSRDFAQVLIRVDGTPEQLQDTAYVTAIAEEVKEKIERSGWTVQRVNVPEAGSLPFQDLFDSIALLLTPLGLLALALSGFLVINTISALMAQQVRQIGIMKSMGGRRSQIVAMYLSAILIYSVVALAVAVPATVAVAGGISGVLGGFINIDFPTFVLPANVLLIQVAVGILVPLLAALYPIYRGTAITVREALASVGAGNVGRADGVSRLLSRVRGISQPSQLSLRNTFRRRGRLALTLVTLVLGGMIFMTVGSVRASLDNLIEQGLSYAQFDISVEFERPYRSRQIEQVVMGVPGVALAETWDTASAVRVRADGTESDPIILTSQLADSQMVEPTLLQGRWLLPADENAIVISQKVLGNEPDIQVGDTVTLKIDDKEGPWVVVGIAQVLSGPPNVVPAYVNAPFYSRYTGKVGQGSSVQILLNEGAADVEETVSLLEQRLDDAGLRVASVFTIERLRRITGGFFDIIVYMLSAMGVLIASVGALGLMGTMSTNVLERTREIGVMRAIGASDGAVQRIVILEGVVIGLLSWLMGAGLAYPIGAGLSTAVGTVLFNTALPYTFSANGVITWFVIVAVLATVASFLPAWNASRLTVREVLAYE